MNPSPPGQDTSGIKIRKPRTPKPPFAFPVMGDDERAAELARMMALHPHLVVGGHLHGNETRANEVRRDIGAAALAAERAARKALAPPSPTTEPET